MKNAILAIVGLVSVSASADILGTCHRMDNGKDLAVTLRDERLVKRCPEAISIDVEKELKSVEILYRLDGSSDGSCNYSTTFSGRYWYEASESISCLKPNAQ